VIKISTPVTAYPGTQSQPRYGPAMRPRRLPAPWSVIEHEEAFEVRDATGQSLGWVYFEDEETRRSTMGRLTRDEARRVASNIAKLPRLLSVSVAAQING
jgi:hypothetical protein